ncbi:MAG: HAD family phosphatase [archaeon]
MVNAVIFDRDGIIIDSESINIDSAIAAFEALGIGIKEEEKQNIIGRHPDDYKEYFLKKYDFSYPEFRKIQQETYYKLTDVVPYIHDTISLIKRLYSKGITLAVNTSSQKEGTMKILEKAKIKNMFKVITTFEDYKNRKPDPESYLVTVKKLGFIPQSCIAIEDSLAGVTAAKAAGMKCIAIPNEYTKNQDLSKADLILDSANQITIELLNKL